MSGRDQRQSRTDIPMSARTGRTREGDTYDQLGPRLEFDNYKASYFMM